MASKTLRDLILAVLQDNSGGVKMTKLITEVVTLAAGKPSEISDLRIIDGDTSPFLNALNTKLAEMETADEIGLLVYGWDMDRGELDGMVREKTFIYTPLEKATLFCCPPSLCKCNCGIDDGPHVCEHKWDGPRVGDEHGDSVTCSRCGMSAMAHDQRCGP